jgi:hypothetical protein
MKKRKRDARRRDDPHATSMAVWNIPSPIPIGHTFAITVGVKCSCECPLTGRVVEVLDENGTKISGGRLGEKPWPGGALYWTTVALDAPETVGVFWRTARFSAAATKQKHVAASASFTFRTIGPAAHTVRIEVIARATQRPIEGVEVRVGPYELFTDAGGTSMAIVPSGTYEISIRKDGYTAEAVTQSVTGDLRMQIEAFTAPTNTEREERMRRYEDLWG